MSIKARRIIPCEFPTFCRALGGNIISGVDDQLGVAHFCRGIAGDVCHAGHLRTPETLQQPLNKRNNFIQCRCLFVVITAYILSAALIYSVCDIRERALTDSCGNFPLPFCWL